MRVRKEPEEQWGPGCPLHDEEEDDEDEVWSDDEELRFASEEDEERSLPLRNASAWHRGRGRRRRGNKRTRLSWSAEMHSDFLTAVDALGGPWTATPKAILDHMSSPFGLTLTNIKSHLQKYRLRSSKEARAEQLRVAAAQAGLLAAPGGSAASRLASRLGGGTLGGRDVREGHGLGDAACLPGMVPVASLNPGPAAAPPPLLRNALVPRAGSAHPASSCAEPKAAASAALAAARQQPELAFSDATLGTEAAALRRRQQQALGAMAAALQQQQQGPGSSAIVAAAGPAHLAVQAVPHRLLRLQLENVQCVRQLHGLHMLQMQRHLEEAARLKRRAAAGVKPAGGSPPSCRVA